MNGYPDPKPSAGLEPGDGCDAVDHVDGARRRACCRAATALGEAYELSAEAKGWLEDHLIETLGELAGEASLDGEG